MGRFTAGPNPLSAAGGGAGAGEADFFLGLPDQLGRGVSTGTWGQRFAGQGDKEDAYTPEDAGCHEPTCFPENR